MRYFKFAAASGLAFVLLTGIAATVPAKPPVNPSSVITGGGACYSGAQVYHFSPVCPATSSYSTNGDVSVVGAGNSALQCNYQITQQRNALFTKCGYVWTLKSDRPCAYDYNRCHASPVDNSKN